MSTKIFLGPGGNCITAPDSKTETSFRHLKKIGLNAQEIEFVQNVFIKPEAAKQLGELARELGVRLSIHGSYYVNFSSEEKAKREASKKRILAACKIGELLGAKIVLFHPGYRGKLSSQQCMEMIVEASEQMARETSVEIGLEIAGKKAGWGTLEEILVACKLVKQCRPVVDWAHIYAVNGGKIDYSTVLDELIKHKVRDLHCHFEGVEFGEGGEKHHLPISSQKPPFAPLAKELAKRKNSFASVTIISESPLLEKDSLVMKKELEKNGVKLS